MIVSLYQAGAFGTRFSLIHLGIKVQFIVYQMLTIQLRIPEHIVHASRFWILWVSFETFIITSVDFKFISDICTSWWRFHYVLYSDFRLKNLWPASTITLDFRINTSHSGSKGRQPQCLITVSLLLVTDIMKTRSDHFVYCYFQHGFIQFILSCNCKFLVLWMEL